MESIGLDSINFQRTVLEVFRQILEWYCSMVFDT